MSLQTVVQLIGREEIILNGVSWTENLGVFEAFDVA